MSDLSKELLEALKREFRLLRKEHDPDQLDDFLDRMQLGGGTGWGPWGSFIKSGKNGEDPRLNPRHKVIKRLLDTPDKQRAHLYYLLSAVYSIANRAYEGIEDEHERDFHSRILTVLLEGRPGRWTEL